MPDKSFKVSGGALHYSESGSGKPILFVQGVWFGRELWDDVVEDLKADHRCIQVGWPLGGHREPLAADADLAPHAVADMVLDMIEGLQLDDVTLVGNDTGGAVCQLAVTSSRPAAAKIGALVLTNSDSYENFPPKAFRPIQILARWLPWLANSLIANMAGGEAKATRVLKSVAYKPVPQDKAATLLANFSNYREARRDSLKFLIEADAMTTTVRAAESFTRFTKPVLILWGREDIYFPPSDGQRLAAAFPNARLVELNECRTFVSLDQTEAMVREIRALLESVKPDY
tara:strand:- start:575 stop:1435 length:861 start_codon:yes stop_codon:yes gene_type:complete